MGFVHNQCVYRMANHAPTKMLETSYALDFLVREDVIKWKHFPRYWPFVRGIQRSLVNSTHKGQRRGTLMFSLICVWINGWVNNREVGDLRRFRSHYDVTVMYKFRITCQRNYVEHRSTYEECSACLVLSCGIIIWNLINLETILDMYESHKIIESTNMRKFLL